MAGDEETIEIVLNPLTFQRADDAWISGSEGKPPTLEETVAYLCGGAVTPQAENLTRRYREITKDLPRLHLAPADPTILGKLVGPLQNAIASYIIGNYYGTIALTGMVCEMLAVFIFEIHQFKISNQQLNQALQQQIFGSTFEKLGQDRRVKALQAFGVIGPEMVASFDFVRTTRRGYLHLLSHDDGAIAKDAIACYRRTFELVEKVFRVEFDNGEVKLRPQIKRYLDYKRVFE